VAQKSHFAVLRIKVTRASRGLSAIAELLVKLLTYFFTRQKRGLPSRCAFVFLHEVALSMEEEE